MPTQMHIEQHYECSAASLAALLMSEEFDSTLLKALDIGREVLAHEVSDDEIVLELKMSPNRKLPGFMQKLAGGVNTYVEHRTWTPSTRSNTWVIEPGISPDKVDIRGTVKIVDDANGGCRRVIDGSFDVRIRLIGRKVEGFIIKQTREGFDRGEAWIRNYIAEQGIT